MRLEALVPDPAAALRMLKAIAGAERVVDHGALGIHRVFEVHGPLDLREDVGALAHAKGWAIRELSWQRPSLEQLFARIALDLPHETPAQDEAPASAAPATPAGGGLALLSDVPLGTSGAEAKAGKLLYNLNPFDGGASRDLSRPKANEGPAPRGPDGA